MPTNCDVRTIVCLANSRKRSGRCIAGKELVGGKPGRWIRPVSARPDEEISEYERQYRDGSDPVALDIIRVPLIKSQPRDYQVENYLISPDSYWEKVGKFAWDDLSILTDDIRILWLNRSETRSGHNDRVSLEDSKNMKFSLLFLALDDVNVSVFAPGADYGNSKRRVQAQFKYNKVLYWLRVTDPVIEQRYLAKQDGEYFIGKAYATISLAEPHDDGFCYKLVAALITPDRI